MAAYLPTEVVVRPEITVNLSVQVDPGHEQEIVMALSDAMAKVGAKTVNISVQTS